ncbi:energy transducer TonB [Thermodesulfobacteriota bacterium]
MSDDPHKPNWLFRGMILLSVGIHLLLFMHMPHLYRPRDISRIELTLKQISSPSQRQIPKPRPRFKPLTDPQERIAAGALDAPYAPMKPFQYVMPAPVDSYGLMGKKQTPRIPVVEGTPVAEWQDASEMSSGSVPSVGERRVMTERTYTDLVQKKIEAVKQYPKRAQRRNDQGVVKIVFTIGNDGEIVSANIIKSSGSRILDRTAIDAVKKASPFARPPNGSIIIQLPIKFELL